VSGDDEDGRPKATVPNSLTPCRGIEPTLQPGADNYGHDAVAPLVELALELAPRLPRSVAISLVDEALDEVACRVLDRRWAIDRQDLYPEAIRCAHNRHVGNSYAERRDTERSGVA
jgi:hypothetical protein